MATFTVTIPDGIVQESIAAARSINDRQRQEDRQPEPLIFGDTEATDVVYQWLHNLIISDLQQTSDASRAAAVRDKVQELAGRRNAP